MGASKKLTLKEQELLQQLTHLNWSKGVIAAGNTQLPFTEIPALWVKLPEIVKKAILRNRTIPLKVVCEIYQLSPETFTETVLSTMIYSERCILEEMVKNLYPDMDVQQTPSLWLKGLVAT